MTVENCQVMEYTGDGVPVGKCYHTLKDGECPRHSKIKKIAELEDE